MTDEPEPPGGQGRTHDNLRALVSRLSQDALEGTDREQVTPIDYMDQLRRDDYQQDIKLKRSVARFATYAVGAQVAVADAVIGVYIGLNHGHVPASVVTTWIGATVVQVIGILVVITRYLFPGRNESGPPRDNPSAPSS